MTHPLLIDTETLQEQLGRAGLVIIDVRGRAAYEFGGHIPGAVHSTWHEYSDPNAIAKGLLDPDLSRIEKKLQSLGTQRDARKPLGVVKLRTGNQVVEILRDQLRRRRGDEGHQVRS